uniref:Major facilitator superfamily (MFS) profile domain-containing protein n=1 Tax=Timema cristinae TaxID=61476 RepID=A0A7R9DIS5_TIMCR|nr:unnamed protein product [Timema cristinae]
MKNADSCSNSHLGGLSKLAQADDWSDGVPNGGLEADPANSTPGSRLSQATFGMISLGCCFGWSSLALPYLQRNLENNSNATGEMDYIDELHSSDNFSYKIPDSRHNRLVNFSIHSEPDARVGDLVTMEEGALISSLLAIGALFGSLPAGYLANICGRKTMIQILNVPLFVGWLAIIFADRNVIILYLARFLQGIALGLSSVFIPLYNEEISEAPIRGALGTIYNTMVNVGVLFIAIAGSCLPYLWVNITSASIVIVSAVALSWIPESPIYLLMKGQKLSAQNSLSILRGSNFNPNIDIGKEFDDMEKLVDKIRDQNKYSCLESLKERLHDFRVTSPTAKTFYIVTLLMVCRQLSGVNGILFYGVDFFRESGSSISPYVSNIVVSIVEVVSGLGSFLLVDRLGRRFILIGCGAVFVFVYFTLSLYLYFKKMNYDIESVEWIPLLIIMIDFFVYDLGIGTISFLMMAELTRSTESKGWITSTASMVNWLGIFMCTYFFPAMIHYIGDMGTYIMFGILNIIGTTFIFLFVPETKFRSG